jgi:hypothetical protein
VDSSGNAYITGYYNSSTLTFYDEDGTAFGTTLSRSGNNDVFIAKYNTDGEVQWAANAGGTGDNYGYGISADSSGNAYVTGYYNSSTLTLYNEDGTAFGTTLSNSSSTFIAKYNTNGVVQWVASCGGQGQSVFVNNGENVYVVGDYTSTLTLYNTDGTAFGTTLSNSGYSDAFIAKYISTPINTFTSLDSSYSLVINTNVGIGTTNPGFELDVRGDANVHNLYATYLHGDGSQLTNIASNLQTITDSGNTTSNTLLLTNADTGLVATGNVEANYLVTNNIFMPESATTISSESFLLSSDASAEWAAKIAGASDDYGQGIAVDSSGNVYVIGHYTSATLNVYSQNTTTPATQLSNSGMVDVFIAKYDTSGVVQWAARVGGSDIDEGYGISTDSSGNVYVIGRYNIDTLTFYNTDDGDSGITLTNSGSGSDVFIAKYDTNGVVQWVVKAAGSSGDYGNSISADSSGNVYVIGHSDSNPLTFYTTLGTSSGKQLSNSGNSDVFIAKYDTNGVVQWAAKVDGSSIDEGYGISADSSGNVYVIGHSDSTTLNVYSQNTTTPATQISNSGGNDVFIAKYDTNGNVDWAANVAGTSDDYGRGIAVDSSGNVYAIGYSDSTTLNVYSQNTTTPATQLSTSGIEAVFIAKYDTNGVVQWAAKIAGASDDYGYGISTDSGGNVYVIGYSFSGTLTFYNAGGTSSGKTIPNSGNSDVFIAKYDTNGVVQWAGRAAGPTFDYGNSISADSSGNVYVIGYSQSPTFTFDTTFGTSSGKTLSNSGGFDVFIAKYTTAEAAFTSLDSTNSLVINTNVGIGTTNPQYSLDVVGDLNFSGFVYRQGNPIPITPWTTGDGKIYYTSGNVGIGTNSPDAKLHVTGNAYVSEEIYAGGDITALSDRRLKTGFKVIEDALQKIDKVSGYTYEKINEAGKRKTGVIAQEILEILPEAIHGSENTMYSVAYGNMAGLFIEAIKELKNRIEVLEAKIK